MLEQFVIAIQIILIDIVMAADNAIIIGLMGHLESQEYLIAVSIASTFFTMILWSFGFLRMGTVGLVSQTFGKSDYRELVNIIFNKRISFRGNGKNLENNIYQNRFKNNY